MWVWYFLVVRMSLYVCMHGCLCFLFHLSIFWYVYVIFCVFVCKCVILSLPSPSSLIFIYISISIYLPTYLNLYTYLNLTPFICMCKSVCVVWTCAYAGVYISACAPVSACTCPRLAERQQQARLPAAPVMVCCSRYYGENELPRGTCVLESIKHKPIHLLVGSVRRPRGLYPCVSVAFAGLLLGPDEAVEESWHWWLSLSDFRYFCCFSRRLCVVSVDLMYCRWRII